MPDKETALLAIPEICVDKIIVLYHASLFAGHQGIIKMYLMMKDKFFIPSLMHYLRSFIKGCHICQLAISDKPPETIAAPNLFKIQTIVKTKHGSESDVKITKGSQVHLVYY